MGLFYNPIEQLVLEQFSAEPLSASATACRTRSSALRLSLKKAPLSERFRRIPESPAQPACGLGALSPDPAFRQFPTKLRPQYSAQYNLTIKRELPGNILLQVGYVGSQGPPPARDSRSDRPIRRLAWI